MKVSRFFADRLYLVKAIALFTLTTLVALSFGSPPPVAAQTTANGQWAPAWNPCNADGSLKGQYDDTLYYHDPQYGEQNCLDATAANIPVMDKKGTLTAYFKYLPSFQDSDDGQYYGPSDTFDSYGSLLPAPPSAPTTQAFAVVTTFWSQTTVGGPGATATVTDSDSTFGDTYTTSDAPNGTEIDYTHIVQRPINGGIVEIDVQGEANAKTSVTTNAGATAWGQVGAYAYDTIDDRKVAISASIDPTYHKGYQYNSSGNPIMDQYGNALYTPTINLRAIDGSMTGDIGLIDVPSPYNDTSLVINYSANRSGDWAIYESTDAWSSSLTNASKNETLNFIYGLEIGNLTATYTRPNPPHVIAYSGPGNNPVFSGAIPGQFG